MVKGEDIMLYRNMSEQAAHLTEMVNARGKHSYLQLARYLRLADEGPYEQGVEKFVRHSIAYIRSHREDFRNIKTRGKSSFDIYSQFDKLRSGQIRLLAAESLVHFHPYLVEPLKTSPSGN